MISYQIYKLDLWKRVALIHHCSGVHNITIPDDSTNVTSAPTGKPNTADPPSDNQMHRLQRQQQTTIFKLCTGHCQLRSHPVPPELAVTLWQLPVWNRPTVPRACSAAVLPPVPRSKDTALSPRSYVGRKTVGLQTKFDQDHKLYFQYP